MTDSSPAVVERHSVSNQSPVVPVTGRPAEPNRRIGIRLGAYGHLTPSIDGSGAPAVGRFSYLSARRAVEILLSAILLVLTTPLVLLGALLVKLTSPGPAFYSQMRVGRNGQPFPIIKLRTMRHNCEAGSGAVWAKAGDPRVTPTGRFLRATHIDELPQLWNVLFGHMSLIGPRPERPEFIPVLEQAIPGYRDRLAIRPGVTGLAQVQLPADTDLASVERKLAYDLYYVAHAGPWLDARVLLATVAKVVGVSFTASRKLFFLPRWEDVTLTQGAPR